MLTMPRKKSKRKRRMVSYRFHEDLLDQLDKLIEGTRRTITAELELAIEEHLSKAGLWPLPPVDVTEQRKQPHQGGSESNSGQKDTSRTDKAPKKKKRDV